MSDYTSQDVFQFFCVNFLAAAMEDPNGYYLLQSTFPIYLYFYSQPFYSKLHQAIVSELSLKFKSYLD